MKKTLFALVLSVCLFAGVGFAVAQDTEVLPTQEVATAQVVTATPPPTAEATIEPTKTGSDDGTSTGSGISSTDLFLVVIVLAALLVSLAMSHKTSHDLAVQVGASIPAFLWQGGKVAIGSGLDTLGEKAKETPLPDDDEGVARLKSFIDAYLHDVDVARAPQLAAQVSHEVAKQLPAAVNSAVETQALK